MSERYPSERPRARKTRGIPTMYRNVKMRSRLEARWAAVFDALGWPWEYEPVDLDWYLPDFVLKFEAGPVLVEVKPDTERDALRDYASKIIASGWRREFMVVGATIWGSTIGLLADDGDIRAGGELVLGPANAFACINCGKTSLLHDDASHRCRVSGCVDAEGDCSHVGEIDREWLANVWAKAGARVQWRPE